MCVGLRAKVANIENNRLSSMLAALRERLFAS